MFYFGADYYPEHWPQERWAEDARLMAEAGMNVVRMAEFAWSLLEPENGRFDFTWLDKAIDVLSAQGIRVVLGTPTAAAPPWLMSQQEDLFLVDKSGMRRTFGLRRAYCPNNLLYHQHTRRIVTAMAEHYQGETAVIGWQIDNEFGDRCYCSICQQAFQIWLQKKYGTLAELNQKWGTIFWSHVYTEWSQIPVPLDTIASHNPGLNLDYYRFMSDSYRAYQKSQIDILRQYMPHHFMTHNLMGFKYPLLNNYDMTEDLDLVSWDNYVRMQWIKETAVSPAIPALNHDTMRSLKKKNFWVMEQQSGSGGWEIVSPHLKPGDLRLWTYQAIAHGADGMVYFRWRTALHGTEQYWHGILDHHGIPGRRYAEVKQVGQELQKMGSLITGSPVHAEVAVMQSYDTRFAFQVQPNNRRFQYEAHIQDIYNGFYDLNIPVDVISEKDNVHGYKAVVVPAMYVLTQETATNLENFAAAGGLVVFTPRTGVKDDANAVVNMKLPGLAARMSGVEVEEYVSLPPDLDNTVQFGLPDLEEDFPASVWADVLEMRGAKVVGWYTADHFANKPAVTINRFGEGNVIYLGTMGDCLFYGAMARWIAALAEVEPLMQTPAGVEVAARITPRGKLLFVLNHTESEQTVALNGRYHDMLNGETAVSGTITLPAKAVSILITAA
ncbi:MAG: beta-galactosidase [Chloroflexota bacterium]